MTLDPEQARGHLSDERNAAYLYRKLAEAEPDARLAELYRRLAVVEDRHADHWARELERSGPAPKPFRPALRTRVLALLARRLGAGAVVPAIAAAERADARKYEAIPGASGLDLDERSHARVLQQVVGSTPGGMAGSVLMQLEGRHRGAGGNTLRAAVLGANDGLVSNLSLVMGVAGAALPAHVILITGLAGLLAGSCAMALGEWLSVQSSRELFEKQLETEKIEIATVPEEEREELALIYQARGLDEGEARRLADRIMEEPASALQTLAREELGIDPGALGGSAWSAAGASFLLFAAGAILPVLPFLVTEGAAAIAASLALSALGLFAIGAGTTLFTGRTVLFSGARQVGFGLAAAAVTFGIGRLLGVQVAG